MSLAIDFEYSVTTLCTCYTLQQLIGLLKREIPNNYTDDEIIEAIRRYDNEEYKNARVAVPNILRKD